ncbi:MAG: hypothetical protein KAG43_02920 [Candidatus Marithrix sp.]|nr:hypothetical protein [Candidatus Marithrix sp.]
MLNNIFKILLLGTVVSCTIQPQYSSPNENYDSSTNRNPTNSHEHYDNYIDHNPTYYDSYPNRNRPTKRLVPVSPPTRSTGQYPTGNNRPIKRIAPNSPPARSTNRKYVIPKSQPIKRIAPANDPNNNKIKYLKPPSSNYVPKVPSSRGYMTKGYASQYQLSEHGMKTATGQIYDMYNMTAAHINLPLMSTVRVKNLRNGRSVIVVINDRLQHGLIKLSYSAAKNLGLLGNHSQMLELRGL